MCRQLALNYKVSPIPAQTEVTTLDSPFIHREKQRAEDNRVEEKEGGYGNQTVRK